MVDIGIDLWAKISGEGRSFIITTQNENIATPSNKNPVAKNKANSFKKLRLVERTESLAFKTNRENLSFVKFITRTKVLEMTLVRLNRARNTARTKLKKLEKRIFDACFVLAAKITPLRRSRILGKRILMSFAFWNSFFEEGIS